MKWFANLILICFVCTLYLIPASVAQPPPVEQPLETTTLPPKQLNELRGHEVPLFYCVRAFFTYSYSILGRGPSKWEILLDNVGILPGSRGDEELRSSILVAAAVWSQTPPPIDELMAQSEAQYAETRRLWRQQQRRGIATVYRGLREAMKNEYGSSVNLDAFVEQRICSGMSVTSTEPFGEEEQLLNAEFDALVLNGEEQ